MCDADLRALERRWHDSRSVEDEARWHAARLRAGLVTEPALVIAAGLGHEAALRLAPAVGLSPLELFDLPEAELAPLPSGSARVRAAIGLARAMAALHAVLVQEDGPEVANEHTALIEAGVAAAERWVRCPCEDHATRLDCVTTLPISDCVPECCWHGADFPGQLIGFALDVVVQRAGRAPRGGWNFTDARDMFERCRTPDLPEGLERTAEDAIRAAVLPWALGLSDPLRA